MQKVIYYEGKVVGTHDDGFIQMRATELLAELLGKRKNQLDLHHSGSVDAVRIYLPDNSRDKPDGD